MAGKRWDWHMNVVQKDVIRVMADDDVVSTATLRYRLIDKDAEDIDITRKYLVRLVKRGLLKETKKNVWKLTHKGRAAAAEARKEQDNARSQKVTRKFDDRNFSISITAWIAKCRGSIHLPRDVH